MLLIIKYLINNLIIKKKINLDILQINNKYI